MIETGIVNAGEVTTQPGTTVKETSDNSTETGSVALESSQEGQESAGGSQESAEGSQVSNQGVRQRGPSKLDTIRELRAKLRSRDAHWENELGTLRSELDSLKAQRSSGNQDEKLSKRFWDAPEEFLDERFDTKLTAFEKRMFDRLEQRESKSQETTEWKQETAKAAEFIGTQKGMTEDDHEDIAELVRSTPEMANMRPLQRARYALFLWKEQRGITDKSALKAKASTVVGAPPSGGARKDWTEAEIESELDKFPKDPKNWTPEQNKAFDALSREFKNAYKENRVK